MRRPGPGCINCAPALPCRGAIYAARSRPSHSSSDPARAATPMRWRRSSASSSTTWRETIAVRESVCLGRLFRRSPKSGVHTRHTPTVLEPAMPSPIHSGDSGNPPATGVVPSMPGMPHRCRSSSPTPSNFSDILPPSPYTTYWGYLSQADTPLTEITALVPFSTATPDCNNHELKYRVSLVENLPKPSWSHPIWPSDQFGLVIWPVCGFSQTPVLTFRHQNNFGEILCCGSLINLFILGGRSPLKRRKKPILRS